MHHGVLEFYECPQMINYLTKSQRTISKTTTEISNGTNLYGAKRQKPDSNMNSHLNVSHIDHIITKKVAYDISNLVGSFVISQAIRAYEKSDRGETCSVIPVRKTKVSDETRSKCSSI